MAMTKCEACGMSLEAHAVTVVGRNGQPVTWQTTPVITRPDYEPQSVRVECQFEAWSVAAVRNALAMLRQDLEAYANGDCPSECCAHDMCPQDPRPWVNVERCMEAAQRYVAHTGSVPADPVEWSRYVNSNGTLVHNVRFSRYYGRFRTPCSRTSPNHEAGDALALLRYLRSHVEPIAA